MPQQMNNQLDMGALVRAVRIGWLPIPMSVYPPPRKPLLWDNLPEPEHNPNPEEFLDRLRDSVKTSLIGFNQVAVLLSGGVDSGTLLTLIRQYHDNVHAFTVDYGTYPDEVQRAREIAKKTNTLLTVCKFGLIDNFNFLRETLGCVHQPVEIAQGPLVDRLIKQADCDVVFSALGGDELMAGYPAHIKCSAQNFQKVEVQQLEKCQSHFVYFQTSSMSVPVKYPYLSPNFISYARGLPLECKRDGRKTKVLVRRAVKGLIPEANRVHGEQVGTKYGFGPNLETWWKNGLGNWVYGEIKKLPINVSIHFIPEIIFSRTIPEFGFSKTMALKGWNLVRLASVPTLLEIHKKGTM